MIHVFIIDDHKILAEAIRDYLDGKEGICCVGMAHSGRAALESIPEMDIDVILLDIGMPEMNGIQCCEELLKINGEWKIIGLSTHQETSIVRRLFKAGAKAYVSKATALSEIDDAIRKVYSGETYMGKIIQKELLSDISGESSGKGTAYSYLPKLTQREKEVLQLIADELTTDEIGAKLFISKNTVETHRKHLISKFGVRNSIGLVKKAMELKII